MVDNFIKKYKLEDIIPVDELVAESKQIVNKFKKSKSLFLSLLIASIIVLIAAGAIYFLFQRSLSPEGVLIFFVILGGLIISAVIFLIKYILTRKSEVKAKKNSKIAKKIWSINPVVFYNRIAQFNAPLKGLEITNVSHKNALLFNANCLKAIKELTFPNRNFTAPENFIEFNFHGKKFVFSIEFVKRRVVVIRDKNGHSTEIHYYTFLDLLFCRDFYEDNKNYYCVSLKNIKRPGGPKWEKFESESIEFNRKFNVQYIGDNIQTFNTFNPLVIDNFNTKTPKNFWRIFIQRNLILNYTEKEVRSDNWEKVCSIYGFEVSGNDDLVNDVNQMMERYEENLGRVWRKLKCFRPLFQDVPKK